MTDAGHTDTKRTADELRAELGVLQTPAAEAEHGYAVALRRRMHIVAELRRRGEHYKRAKPRSGGGGYGAFGRA